MDKARHAIERGVILQALKSDFASRMTGTATLFRTLDLLGYSMGIESLEFHLALLSASGYVRIWRASDMPGWRADRPNIQRSESIVFSRLEPKGLQLIDGDVISDPSVAFNR